MLAVKVILDQDGHIDDQPPRLDDTNKENKTGPKKKRDSKIEQFTKKAYIELGSLAMKAAAVITASLAGRSARNTHHRSRDWCTEDNY